jgi:hypothetical protein
MKKKKDPVTIRDAERALFHTLKDEGELPPASEEEIAELEEELGVYPAGTTEVHDVFRMMREGMREPEAGESEAVKEIESGLAQAARHGRKIPRHIRELMERDREEAEREDGAS